MPIEYTSRISLTRPSKFKQRFDLNARTLHTRRLELLEEWRHQIQTAALNSFPPPWLCFEEMALITPILQQTTALAYCELVVGSGDHAEEQLDITLPHLQSLVLVREDNGKVVVPAFKLSKFLQLRVTGKTSEPRGLYPRAFNPLIPKLTFHATSRRRLADSEEGDPVGILKSDDPVAEGNF
ncbi:hypothetical protein C8R43DRAFT_948110 [Mycena crocata]|nr:hypothetical protein C8R43DRAFT_948110 [Mycena crocata]